MSHSHRVLAGYSPAPSDIVPLSALNIVFPPHLALVSDINDNKTIAVVSTTLCFKAKNVETTLVDMI
jgi:hypothetical protein